MKVSAESARRGGRDAASESRSDSTAPAFTSFARHRSAHGRAVSSAEGSSALAVIFEPRNSFAAISISAFSPLTDTVYAALPSAFVGNLGPMTTMHVPRCRSPSPRLSRIRDERQ